MHLPDLCPSPLTRQAPTYRPLRGAALSAALLAAVLGLQACSTAPRGGVAPPASPAPAGAPATASTTAPTSSATNAQTVAPAAPPATLATERQWLQSWFAGTPVQISQRGDGPLAVSVPREFCFDAGRSTIKPALAAVLDKVAESLRRVPQARLQQLAAPADAGAAAGAALAVQRAAQLRARLLSRGVQVAQLTEPTAAADAAVLIQVALKAP
jgi:outer membrane protein OmpA-like peptidoglycan-associated protein